MEGVVEPFEIKCTLKREDIEIYKADVPSVNSVDSSYFKGKSVVLKSNAVLAIVCPDRIAAEGLEAEERIQLKGLEAQVLDAQVNTPGCVDVLLSIHTSNHG